MNNNLSNCKVNDWISIEDNLPEINQETLILLDVGGNIERGLYVGNGKFKANWCNTHGSNCAYKVTHWMLLPELPCEFRKGDRVLVTEFDGDSMTGPWFRRYFACMIEGRFMCYADGKDEWASKGKLDCGWKLCKKWEEE